MDATEKELFDHAEAFLHGGLNAQTDYYPSNSYGRKAEQIHKWAKKAFRLIEQHRARQEKSVS